MSEIIDKLRNVQINFDRLPKNLLPAGEEIDITFKESEIAVGYYNGEPSYLTVPLKIQQRQQHPNGETRLICKLDESRITICQLTDKGKAVAEQLSAEVTGDGTGTALPELEVDGDVVIRGNLTVEKDSEAVLTTKEDDADANDSRIDFV